MKKNSRQQSYNTQFLKKKEAASTLRQLLLQNYLTVISV